MSSERKDKMYSKIMDTLGLIHVENTILMELIIRTHCGDDENARKVIEDLGSEWQRRFEELRKW